MDRAGTGLRFTRLQDGDDGGRASRRAGGSHPIVAAIGHLKRAAVIAVTPILVMSAAMGLLARRRSKVSTCGPLYFHLTENLR
ncbi:hypothetical protein MES5069_770006 [Mesorhizobium escarrei]|uniref:Uncharacterized protein n=1 Tax=Mesorhizobium escarrei TaxID=666018 RepID=A0ABM9EIH0_9HYPH|nr:hypothetical protein MES5069_770006 [Mesorhizobium escarrei]